MGRSFEVTATEDTLNDLIASYLRSQGVDITTQFSGRAPQGRRGPDFELHTGGVTYYGEGEWLSSYHEGLLQALDFGDIPGAAGYFVLGYPDHFKAVITERRVESADPASLLAGLNLQRCLFGFEDRRSDLRSLRIEHVADWIKSVTSKEEVSPDPQEFLSLMRYSVESLANLLPRGKGSSRIFEHVVATIPEKTDEEAAARKGSAYLLLNQIIFYRILASHPELGYDQIDPRAIRSPLDLKALFERVMVDDYNAIFKTNVVDLFPQQAFRLIRSIIKITSGLRPEAFTRNLLGSMFHELIPKEVRHPVAAYYTNTTAARLLVRLASVSGRDRVTDFACGSGTLLVAAYDQKSLADSRANDQNRHAAYLETELTGLDVMPFAAHLAVVQLALMNPAKWTNKVRIAVEDSLEKRVGERIRSLERRAVSPQTRLTHFGETPETIRRSGKGAISTDGVGTEFDLTRPDVVIMNPPFSRKQFISTAYRGRLEGLFGDYSRYSSKEMGYWGYFLLLGDKFLEKGGRLALVVPTSLLRHESARGLRQLLRDRYDIEYIVASSHTTAFSEDASWPDILLVATKGKSANPHCKFAMLRSPLNDDTVDWITDRLRSGEQSEGLLVENVTRPELEADDWLPFLPGAVPPSTMLSLPRGAPVSKLSELKDSKVIQGIRLEKKSPFVHPDDTLLSRLREARTRVEWQVVSETPKAVVAENAVDGRRVTVPRTVLVPATRSISGHRTLLVYPEPPDYVVSQRFRGDDRFWRAPNPEGMLVRRREHLSTREGRVVIAGYSNVNLAAEGTSLLAVAASDSIVPTWNCWSVKLADIESAKILTLWWNSCFNLLYLLYHRTEREGTTVMWRKDVLESAPVLDVRKLTASQRKEAIQFFDSLSQERFEPLLRQYSEATKIRHALDTHVAVLLGLPRNEIPARLNDIYVAISTQLGELVAKMSRGGKGGRRGRKSQSIVTG